MKVALVIILSLAYATAQEEAPVAEVSPIQPIPEPNTRILPADVLRDYQGVCFGSTALRTFEIGEQWSLAPFCGVARCRQFFNGALVEEVQDCGPVPNPHNCTISNTDMANEEYPICCPKYTCPEGETISYPESNIVAPISQLIPLESETEEPVETTTVQ